MACELWPDQDQARALSNLRSAIWRMPEVARKIIGRCGASVTLLDSLVADLDEAAAVARRLNSRSTSTAAMTVDRELLMDDLLPSFDEAWLVVPREQHRQRRLHALETLALDDPENGRPLDAVDTAWPPSLPNRCASPHNCCWCVHISPPATAPQPRSVPPVCHLLATELQVEPSAAMTKLVEQSDPASSNSVANNSHGDTTVTVLH